MRVTVTSLITPPRNITTTRPHSPTPSTSSPFPFAVQGIIYELNFRTASPVPNIRPLPARLRVRCPWRHIHHVAGILSALDVDKEQHYAQHQAHAAHDNVGDAQERILTAQQRRRREDHLFGALKVRDGVSCKG